MKPYKIGDKVKVIRSHRQDFEGMIGKIIEIKGDDLKYHVLISKNFSLWARKVELVNIPRSKLSCKKGD